MRVIHLADLHAGCFRYGKKVEGYHTADLELESCLYGILELKPDLVLMCGDIYDHPNPETSSRSIVNYFIQNLQQEKRTTVLLIPGNHDLSGPISSLHPEKCLLPENGNIFIAEEPFIFETSAPGCRVFSVPFIKDQEILQVEMEEMIRARKKFSDKIPNILVAHFPIPGGESDTGKVPTGIENIYDWATHFDYVALGDLHVNQKIGDNIWYSGSPRWITFPVIGASKKEKGYNIIETENFKKTGNLEVYFQKCFSAREFKTLMIPDLAFLNGLTDLKGSVIRAFLLKETIPVDKVVEILYGLEASFVKPSYLLEKSETITEATNFIGEDDSEIFTRYFKSRNIDPQIIEDLLEQLKEVNQKWNQET